MLRIVLLFVAPVVLATVTCLLLRDELLCPSGQSARAFVRIETQTGKGGLGVECRDGVREPTRRGVFPFVMAWLGILVAGAAAGYFAWRRLAPREAAAFEPTPAAPGPTDKRERRRERKKQDAERRRGR